MCRVALGNDGVIATIFNRRFPLIQSQIGFPMYFIRAVTVKTAIGQNRQYVSIRMNGFFGEAAESSPAECRKNQKWMTPHDEFDACDGRSVHSMSINRSRWSSQPLFVGARTKQNPHLPIPLT